MATVIPYSEACERNKNSILEHISPFLDSVDRVLEVGSGTAQHAVYFAQEHPDLLWQTTDQSHYLEGIRAQIENAQLANVLLPFELDVNQYKWLPEPRQFPLIYTANTMHIMSESDIRSFFAGIGQVINDKAVLIIYGPFKYGGKFTSESNADFDLSLRSRGEGSGIRAFEWIEILANNAGFSLLQDVAMPANNQILIWQHGGN